MFRTKTIIMEWKYFCSSISDVRKGSVAIPAIDIKLLTRASTLKHNMISISICYIWNTKNIKTFFCESKRFTISKVNFQKNNVRYLNQWFVLLEYRNNQLPDLCNEYTLLYHIILPKIMKLNTILFIRLLMNTTFKYC